MSILICIVLFTMLLLKNSEAGSDDKVVLNTKCDDKSFKNGKTIILDDDAMHIIRCQNRGKSVYLTTFRITAKVCQYHVYFATGETCQIGQPALPKDSKLTDWDKDPELARKELLFVAFRDDSHLFEGDTARRVVTITNLLVTPKKEREWFCFLIIDDERRPSSDHTVTIQFSASADSAVFANQISFPLPVGTIPIKGVALDETEVVGRPITHCCRLMKSPADTKPIKYLNCEFEEISKLGNEAKVKFTPAITEIGYIQVANGQASEKEGNGGKCPTNFVTVGKVTKYSIWSLLNDPKYGPIIIGGCACVILLFCWCFQQYQKKQMVSMIAGGNRK